MDSTAKRSIVVYSPHSGRSDQLAQAEAQLQQMGIAIMKSIPIADLDHLPPQGTRWKQEDIDVAIAAGGDGLVGGVINHIAESGLPLGILPLGTSNDIARSLQIPQSIQQAAEVIADGKVQAIDIGTARPAEQVPHPASSDQRSPVVTHIEAQKHGYFAHALTVGLNVQFARIATNVATRQRFGRLTYPFAALELLRNHDPLEVELRFEGLAMPQSRTATREVREEHTATLATTTEQPPILRCRALQVTVINAPIFGGQWELAIPDASLNDRLLDIVVIEEIELGRLSTRLAHLFEQKANGDEPASVDEGYEATRHPGELTGIPGIHHLQARGVMIMTNVDPRDATLDGEVRGQTPMFVHIADERLRVLVPR
ncbi:MAG TPA: diacylglycerol kinase family protein [Ktedonobacteraceae bacterium]|nr:diacylglycerol kinase family protein [Ktedonobacteraceae bacterium]